MFALKEEARRRVSLVPGLRPARSSWLEHRFSPRLSSRDSAFGQRFVEGLDISIAIEILFGLKNDLARWAKYHDC